MRFFGFILIKGQFKMHYYIISGELSGDLYGSKLIENFRKIDASAKFSCWGGENIEKQKVDIIQTLDKLSFLGFWEVLKNTQTIINNFRILSRSIKSSNPDALILIDYPGFNLRAAKFASNIGIPVFWVVAPQLWAWKESRIKYLQKYINNLYVIFPFELDFFAKKGVNTFYFGHPLVDMIPNVNRNKKTFKKSIIVLMPGSRRQEIKKILPSMLSASKKFKNYRFVIICAQGIKRSFYENIVGNYDVELFYDKKILESAHCALVASGTASIELAIWKIPQVVCYKMNWMSYVIAKYLSKVKYISMVNILANKTIVKELIQEDFNVLNIQNELERILDDKNRIKMIEEYSNVVKSLGPSGSIQKISRSIYDDLTVVINSADKR